ncbi:MAG: hypothetical protein AAB942_00205 [Patescibacteria group bacterium]
MATLTKFAWFDLPDTPFNTIAEFARAIVGTSGHHFFGKSAKSTEAYLYHIIKGHKPYSDNMLQAVEVTVQVVMERNDATTELIVERLAELWKEVDANLAEELSQKKKRAKLPTELRSFAWFVTHWLVTYPSLRTALHVLLLQMQVERLEVNIIEEYLEIAVSRVDHTALSQETYATILKNLIDANSSLG